MYLENSGAIPEEFDDLWGRKCGEFGEGDDSPDPDLDAEEGEEGEPTEGDSTEGEDTEEGEPGLFDEKFDPNNLDPALQKAYKQMQGDYTRKTQGVAEQQKTLQAQSERVKWLEDFENLSQTNPKLAGDMLMSMARQFIPDTEGQSQNQDTPSYNGVTPEQIDWEMESPGFRYIAGVISQLTPFLQQLQQQTQYASQYVATQHQQMEITNLKTELGEFDDQTLLAESKKYPQGTPLRLVAIGMLYPDIKKKAVEEAYNNKEEKKKANQHRPGSSKTQSAKGADTIEEAFAMALKEHGMSRLIG